jgi:PAS domain S-box-containing protein
MSKPKTKQELQDEIDRLREQVAELESKLTDGGTQVCSSLSREARLEALFYVVDYPVTHFDRDGTILDVNEAGAAILGMTRDEVVGQTIYDLVPDTKESLPERFRYTFETGKAKRYEFKIDAPTGSHWFTSHYVPVKEADGSVCCVLVVSFDITDLKQVEEQQRLVSSIIKQSVEGVVLLNLDGSIKYANDSAARMHGYEASELVGKSVAMFHSEDQMAAVQTAIEQIQATGEFSGEIWHVHRDGHVFPTTMHSFMLFGENGQPVGMVGIARDISELKQAEKKQAVLSSIVKQSLEGVALVDLDGNIEFINDAFARMHGYESKELIGKNLSIFHTEDQMPAVLAVNEQIRTTGEFNGEVWHVHRDGNVFPTVMHNSLLYDDKGEPIGIVGTLRDITETKLAEAELRESRERYRLLIDNIGCPIMLYDLHGILLLINDDGARNLGGVPGDLIGKTLDDLVPGKAGHFAERHKRITESGVGEEHSDTVDTPLGRRWFWSNVQPARKSDGTIYGVQIVSRDVTELKDGEEALRIMADELKTERGVLHEKNIALKQVLDHMENQKQDWARKLQASLEKALSPFLDELAKVAGPERADEFEELRSTLDAILAADSDEFSRRFESLTAREIEICEVIAKGRSSKEIAEDMNLSLLTILKHREKIRKKLGLTGKKVDLGAYLRRHLASPYT